MLKKTKCDIIVPVYNSLDWVKMCIFGIFTNTDFDLIENVFLINDKSDKETSDYLKMISKTNDKIVLINNRKNLGYLKSCNYAMSISNADFILLLNSDCILSKNAVKKMMDAMKRDKKIGLLCPISTRASNLSFSIVDGANYQSVNRVFEKKFRHKTFDACTVVGNCLMISRECYLKTGNFDEIYEKGYTEETDYQFKAEDMGFKAKILIDTFVFHERRATFGENDKTNETIKRHLKIFFDRYGDRYSEKMEKYMKNDPIKYIESKIKDEDFISDKCKTVIIDEVNDELISYINFLIISGFDLKVLTKNISFFDKKKILFSPLKK